MPNSWRFEDARRYCHEALEIASRHQNAYGLALTLSHTTMTAALRSENQRDDVARLMGFVDARFTMLGSRGGRMEQREYDLVATRLREKFDVRELERLMSEGAQWPESTAIAQAEAM